MDKNGARVLIPGKVHKIEVLNTKWLKKSFIRLYKGPSRFQQNSNKFSESLGDLIDGIILFYTCTVLFYYE